MSADTDAIVRPRIRSPFSGEAVLLEDFVQDLLSEGRSGVVHVHGPPGWGTKTALSCLRGVFPEGDRVALRDPGDWVGTESLHQRLTVLFTLSGTTGIPEGVIEAPLLDWSWDEGLEYLQARHPDGRTSVMGRLRASDDVALLEGCPRLWALVLDLMAEHHALRGAADVLRAYAASCDIHADDAQSIVRWLLYATPSGPVSDDAAQRTWRRVRLDYPHLAHRPLQLVWAARVISDAILSRQTGFLDGTARPPPDFVACIATELADRRAGARRLRKLIRDPRTGFLALALSVLHRLDGRALRRLLVTRARSGDMPDISEARLRGLDGHDLALPSLTARRADLREADFHGANLCDMRAPGARFAKANFDGADLSHVHVIRASFRRCHLHGSTLDQATLTAVDMRGAVLDGASLRGARLLDADLRGAKAYGADFTGATLHGARVRDADFTGACFNEASLHGVDFRGSVCAASNFHGAVLVNARFEGVDLHDSNFQSARLQSAGFTGACASGASFKLASLARARLAFVDMEGANLRGADLTHAQFHLGSSRSGLVFSPYASEGTRTGFYTEDDEPLDFHRPEEIRKANLRGADLRGAKVEDTDFYLVDLRDIRCDEKQRQHFRDCKAILE